MPKGDNLMTLICFSVEVHQILDEAYCTWK